MKKVLLPATILKMSFLSIVNPNLEEIVSLFENKVFPNIKENNELAETIPDSKKKIRSYS